MLSFVKLVFLLAIPASVNAAPDYGSVTISGITSVYDGDTFRANIPNYPPIVGENIGIRINGIDTPEIRGKCPKEVSLAKDAQRFAEKTLRSAKVVELRNLQRGKYFRVVADVYADGVNVGDALVNESLAVVYDGGRKTKDWCEQSPSNKSRPF